METTQYNQGNKTQQTVDAFKKELKTHLFRKAYN